MDEWRNSITSKIRIEIIEWPNHNEIFCPAIKFGGGIEYQVLPEGVFPEDSNWLFLLEYLADIFEFEKRHKHWLLLEKIKVRILYKKWYRETQSPTEIEYEFDIDNYELWINEQHVIDNYKDYYKTLKYKPWPEPKQITSPIPWEYK